MNSRTSCGHRHPLAIFGDHHRFIGVKATAKDRNAGGLGLANHGVRVIGNLLPFMILNLHVAVVERNDESRQNPYLFRRLVDPMLKQFEAAIGYQHDKS